MKLTPEQKAFFEYGGAWETTVVIHTFIRRLLKDKGYQLSPELLHHYRDEKSHYRAVLREAWKKRRVCRAWVHPMRRRCSNCKHELTQYKFCAACVHEGWPVYWEPRKEEQDND